MLGKPLAGTFAHSIDLHDRDVEAHEKVKSFFRDRSCGGKAQPAAVEAKRHPHFLEDDTACQAPTIWL